MKLIKWLLRAWPFIIISFIAFLHFIVINIISNGDVDFFNKIISSFVQVSGGLVVLSNINSNLGLFGKISLMEIFKCWIKSFPYFRSGKNIKADISCELPFSIISLDGSIVKSCNTLEEKIEDVQRQINELRDAFYIKENEMLKKISQIEYNLRIGICNNKCEIEKLNELVCKSSTGSINVQVFGVLLVVYGSVISVVI
ncbi:MAG: hypothetical protein EOL88_14335 [Bacteroidia bacterium]|nr:hypothetical protein [Bacteroidia bacterium]